MASTSMTDRLIAARDGFMDPARLKREQGITRRMVIPEENNRTRYQMLEWYRDATVYQKVIDTALTLNIPVDYGRLRFIENPAYQAVQYGVMHILGGPLNEALELLIEGNDLLAEACETVFRWSNMAAQKDNIIDEVYTKGDVWLQTQVNTAGDEVFIDVREPEHVTAFREDNKRNTKYIRLDMELDDVHHDEPNGNGAAGRSVKRYWTEIWDNDDFPPPLFPPDDPLFDEAVEITRVGRRRIWIHVHGLDANLDILEKELPVEDVAITDIGGAGNDFVPFVRVPRQPGTKPNKRSKGVFELHIEAIDQLLRIATELDEAYREHSDGMWAVLRGESGKDAIEMIDQEEKDEEADVEGQEKLIWGRKVATFPGMARAEDMVPNIDYQAGLDKVEDHHQALARSMSELRYFRGVEQGDPSAQALRIHHAPAIKSAELSRGNAEDGIARSLGMTISWAQARGLIETNVGSFVNGDFAKIGFVKRAIIPETPEEKQNREGEEANILSQWKALGPELFEKFLVEQRGFEPGEAKTIAQAAQQREERERTDRIANGLV